MNDIKYLWIKVSIDERRDEILMNQSKYWLMRVNVDESK